MKKQAERWMVAAMLCAATSGLASSDLVFTWEKVFADKPLPAGADLLPVTNGMDRMLRIKGGEGAHTTVRLLTVNEPTVTSMVYAIAGRMAYTRVKGDGYIDLIRKAIYSPQKNAKIAKKKLKTSG